MTGQQQTLDSIEVQDTEGRAVRLADLWREQALVLGFVRHFG
ncbi:MAG: hypothetical protein ACI8QC_000512 [Planctomycetota bacterium]|jgi:hypothetical protein